MQVKGSMMLYVVKAIRGDTSGAIAAKVASEDRPFLADRIMPGRWYPYDAYKRLFNLLIDAYATGNPATIRKWGRDSAEEIIGTVYRSAIQPGNPYRTLKNNEIRFTSFYDFGAISVEPDGDAAARITLSDFDADWKEIHSLIAGWLERTLELAGARSAKVEIIARSWSGDPATVFHATWA